MSPPETARVSEGVMNFWLENTGGIPELESQRSILRELLSRRAQDGRVKLLEDIAREVRTGSLSTEAWGLLTQLDALAAAPAPSAPATAVAEPNDKAGGADGSATRKDADTVDTSAGFGGPPSPPAASPPPAPQVAETIEQIAAEIEKWGMCLGDFIGLANRLRTAMRVPVAPPAPRVAADGHAGCILVGKKWINPLTDHPQSMTWQEQAAVIEHLRALSAAAPPTRGEGAAQDGRRRVSVSGHQRYIEGWFLGWGDTSQTPAAIVEHDDGVVSIEQTNGQTIKFLAARGAP